MIEGAACVAISAIGLLLFVGLTAGINMKGTLSDRGFDDTKHWYRWKFDTYEEGDEWRGQRRNGDLVCEECEKTANSLEEANFSKAMIVNVDDDGTPIAEDGVSFDETTRVLCLDHIEQLRSS